MSDVLTWWRARRFARELGRGFTTELVAGQWQRDLGVPRAAPNPGRADCECAYCGERVLWHQTTWRHVEPDLDAGHRPAPGRVWEF